MGNFMDQIPGRVRIPALLADNGKSDAMGVREFDQGFVNAAISCHRSILAMESVDVAPLPGRESGHCLSLFRKP